MIKYQPKGKISEKIVKAVSVYRITNVKKWLIEETAKNEDIDIETVRAISEGLFDAFHDKEKHVAINTNPNCYYLSNVLDLFREYPSLKHNFSSQEIENNFDLLMTLESYIEMIVVQRVNRKSCIWYNMYLCNGINKISHLLETRVGDPSKDKYVADFLGSHSFFSHQMKIKYQPKRTISEKIVKAVSVYGITNVQKWLIEETAKNEDIDIETMRAISEGLFDAFHDKEKHVTIITNPNHYYLSNELDLFREYVSLKHNFSSQEIENNFDLLMTLESYKYIEMIVVQRVNRKSCVWYNMYLCSGINKISHLLETGVSHPCQYKYVADFLGSPPFFFPPDDDQISTRRQDFREIVKAVSVYGITNVKKWLIEETAKNEDIDIETVRAISEGLFDAFNDKKKHVTIYTNPNCYYLSNVLDLFRENVSLKYNFSSQEIENDFDLLMTLESYIVMIVVQRVNRKSCIWYNMYLCSGINKISHLLETGVSDPCKYKYVADFLGSPTLFFPTR